MTKIQYVHDENVLRVLRKVLTVHARACPPNGPNGTFLQRSVVVCVLQSTEGALEGPLGEALRAGYRHIDTAAMYVNEDVIGKVLEEDWLAPGKLKREDLFIVTKLPLGGMEPGGPERCLKSSLEKLRLEYVDLYLIHSPFYRNAEGNFPDDVDHVAIWKVSDLYYGNWQELRNKAPSKSMVGRVYILNLSAFFKKTSIFFFSRSVLSYFYVYSYQQICALIRLINEFVDY